MRIYQSIQANLFLICVLYIASSTAFANTSYSYTGNSFTDYTTPYTGADRISGSFVVAEPLAPGSENDLSGSLIDFRFTDGKQTRIPSNTSILYFYVSVDLIGNFSSWSIVLVEAPVATAIGEQRETMVIGYHHDALSFGVPMGYSYEDVSSLESICSRVDTQGACLTYNDRASQYGQVPTVSIEGGPFGVLGIWEMYVASAKSVPTLNGWILILLITLLCGAGIYAASKLEKIRK